MADLNGAWLGTYWQDGQPTRFEATLIQSNNVLTGSILDDGPCGEATLNGEILGRRVSFIKRYVASQPYPVQYTGTVSEDGDYLQGDWTLGGSMGSGTWEARRNADDLMADLTKLLSKQLSLVGSR